MVTYNVYHKGITAINHYIRQGHHLVDLYVSLDRGMQPSVMVNIGYLVYTTSIKVTTHPKILILYDNKLENSEGDILNVREYRKSNFMLQKDSLPL